MRRITLIAFGLSVLSAMPCSAQSETASKYTISVNATTEDDIGKQFAYAIREELRKSAKYALIEDGSLSAYQISLVTLDPNEGRSQTMTVAAVTLTAVNMASLFLNEKVASISQSPLFNLRLLFASWVRTVGSSRVEDSARSLVASVDKEVIELRDRVNKFVPK